MAKIKKHVSTEPLRFQKHSPEQRAFERGFRDRDETPHLITSLSLSDEDESIGANDGEAEVDEDDGAFGTDVPEGRKKVEEKISSELEGGRRAR